LSYDVGVLALLRKLFRRAPSPSPHKVKRRRRLPKRISREQAEALLAVPDLGTNRGLRDRAILELMYRAGLRVSEVVNLRPRDVHETGVVNVWEGKGGVDRTSYFDPGRVWPHVEAWLRARRRFPGATEDAPLFCHRDGRPITTRTVQYMVDRCREAAGITAKCTPHTLRHSFASELLEDGFNTREVQQLLGHSSVATTEAYTWITDSRLSDKVRGRGP
jgi:integrase/recombinase XerD